MSDKKMLGETADGWFREESVMWPGQAMSLKIQKVESVEKTKFQDLAVFENDGPWGTVMALDGAIQVTDKDEFVYHENMANIPLTLHPNPKKVLIIGGGDGGVLREVLKHPSVEKVDLVDIDEAVVKASEKYFPQIGCHFKHPKANVMIGDGATFVKNCARNGYDIIIVDSTDPEGPASVLFGMEFYSNLHGALTEDGIVCSQGESIWLHMHMIEKMKKFLKDEVKFTVVKYGIIYIPTYPCGSIGALISSKKEIDVSKPLREVERYEYAKELKYYNTAMHKAAFALPNFAKHLNS